MSINELSWSDLALLLPLGLAVIALVLIATARHIDHARRLSIIARPNERSMHKKPVPTGGGWPIVLAASFAFLLFHWPQHQPQGVAIPLLMLLLAALSWFDDRYELSPRLRLAAHALAVVVALWLLRDDRPVFASALPLWIDRTLAALGWLWFINLFNFMDGIDGIAGSEVIAVLFGLLVLGTQIALPAPTIHLAIVVIAASAGFLWWNWAPARVYLGDTGSIPLGFLLGYLLIELAKSGHLAAALLLPLAFVADATLTLLRRLGAGEKVWRPHRSHYYQRAALALGSHTAVVWRFAIANAALIGCALLTLHRPLIGVLIGLGVAAALLLHLRHVASEG